LVKIFNSTQTFKMSLVLQFELILKIGSIKCAYGGRQENISRAPRWTGLLYDLLQG
jgi:hypothetical protein